MQRLISIVALVGAVVQLRSAEPADVSATREVQQLNKQLNAALSLKDQEKQDLTAATARVGTAEKKLSAQNAQLMKKLEDVRGKARSLTDQKTKLGEEDKASSAKLHELVDKMQSALSVAKNGEDAATAASPANTAGKALVQMDPEPVMDKVPTGGVPEQGFEGVAVEHKYGETSTGDWGKEYGHKKQPVPSSAFAPAICLALYALF